MNVGVIPIMLFKKKVMSEEDLILKERRCFEDIMNTFEVNTIEYFNGTGAYVDPKTQAAWCGWMYRALQALDDEEKMNISHRNSVYTLASLLVLNALVQLYLYFN